MIKHALDYLEQGFSVIPITPNAKKPPLFSWKEFQTRRSTEAEVLQWWEEVPNANIGIVTGSVSNIVVIDIDTEEAWETFAFNYGSDCTRVVKTPHGYHVYFRTTNTQGNRVGFLPGIDVRGEKGYVVAPPSKIFDISYEWLQEGELKPIPEGLISYSQKERIVSPASFSRGFRDDSLFHIALTLVKGGMSKEEILHTILQLAQTCDPPCSEKKVAIKVASAFQYAGGNVAEIEEMVKQWLKLAHGAFSFGMVYKDLGLNTTSMQKTCRIELEKAVENSSLERYGNKYGWYRIRQDNLKAMEWKNANVVPIEIVLPFALHRMVTILPKNIMIIAGMQNAGKTAFLLNIVKDNQARFPIHYFSSEMGDSELKTRLIKWPGMKLNDWTFKAYERRDCWEDIIFPNDINIIDFLEINEEFWKVAYILNRIHDRLDQGLAIIGLQKGPGDMGRGGTFSLEKARLYLNLDIVENETRKLFVKKAKNIPDGGENPNGKSILFKINEGGEIIPTSSWSGELKEKIEVSQKGLWNPK